MAIHFGECAFARDMLYYYIRSMRMTNRKKLFIYLGIIAGVIILLILLDRLKVKNPSQNVIHRFDACESVEELAARLTRDIESGIDGTDTLYAKDVPIDDILNINYYIGTIDGAVNSVAYTGEIMGVMRVDFDIVRSDNSYVYRCYKYKEPIPDDRENAKKLYKKVSDFMILRIKGSMSDYEKELAIHDFIIENCDYSYGSKDNENEYRAYGALVEGKAVCNGYAEAMALLLSCAGIENKYITGSAGDELHAWNLVKLGDNWYHVDATWDDPVLDIIGDATLHAYFNLSDDKMKMSHTWNEDYFEACDSMAFNYYNMNNLYFDSFGDFKNNIQSEVIRNKFGVVECAFKSSAPTGSDLEFIFDYGGIKSFQFSNDGGGDYNILVMYLNK